jgi:hypothetical protein
LPQPLAPEPPMTPCSTAKAIRLGLTLIRLEDGIFAAEPDLDGCCTRAEDIHRRHDQGGESA